MTDESYLSKTSPHSPTALEWTWELESIFPDVASWEEEFHAVQRALPQIRQYEGRLCESADTLYAYLRCAETLSERVGKLHTYAYHTYYGNTLDEAARILLDRAQQLGAELGAASAFFEPEILRAAPLAVVQLVEGYNALKPYRYLFEEIERWRSHICSAEVEELLETLSPVTAIPMSVRTSLHDADMRFSSFDVDEQHYEVTHGSIEQLLSHPNRHVRRLAYQRYTDPYLPLAQTFGQTLTAQATTSHILNKARKFSSTFEAAIFAEGLTEEVFHRVLQSCREHRPLFHRYFRARAALLGVPTIAEYDLMAPLSSTPPPFPYERARDVVLAAIKPLGDEYVAVARRGLYEERWVDVYPRPGKYSNAFSGGSYGTRPFLLLNFAPTITEVGTLAHELGHSMHFHLTNTHQPSSYSSCVMSVAETASNLNQVLLRARLLQGADRDMTLAVLEEAFFFAHRYLFLMPTLSEVEHHLHERYAAGGAISASELSSITCDAFCEAYGGTVEIDPPRLGMTWAKFCHFYSPYYFFQYAIGISAAMAIGQRILAGEPGAKESYLEFLAAGASKAPIELFRITGVDITSPEFYRAAFTVVEGYVERLEGLVTV